jgi:hypothetical protein
MNVQKPLLIVFILLLLFLTTQAISKLSANLNFYHTFQLKELWLKNAELPNKLQYVKALNAIELANEYHPKNPEYLITQGLILEWAGVSKLFSEQEQNNNLLLAKAYYIKATNLRPTWAVTWANLAVLKWRLNEIDQTLINYLIQANKYGKNVTEVRKIWVDVGLFLYQNKSPYSSQVIRGLRQHLKLMLQDDRVQIRKSAVSIVKRHNAERFVCKWIRTYSFDTTWQQKALCKLNKTK